MKIPFINCEKIQSSGKKKLGFWGLLAAVIIGLITAVCFLTSPSEYSESTPSGESELLGTEDSIAHYADYEELLKAFPGEYSVDADGNMVITVSVMDYECAATTSSITGETRYCWSSPNRHRQSPKTYPLEIRNGKVQEVAAKLITEEDLLKYTFGENLVKQAYQAFPSGIKQYILRENGTVHVNVGYDTHDFLNLQYMTFQISEDKQTAALSEYGMGYYLLQVNDSSSLKAFRDDFTGEGHFLPSDTSQLPWDWLITMNGEEYYRPQLNAEDVPTISHSYHFESLPHQNIHDFYCGFYASEIWNNGTYYTRFLYRDEKDEIIILTDKQNQVISLTMNGIDKELPAQPLSIYYGNGGAHGLCYYADVTEDGEKELIFTEGYRNNGDSYVFLPDSMKQLTFEKDIEEITSKISIEYQNADTEENYLYYSVCYENQTAQGKEYYNFSDEKFIAFKGDKDMLSAASEYVTYTPQKEASFIYYDEIKNCFSTEIWLFINNTYESVFDILHADYIWDADSKQFVIDMDTVSFAR